MRLGSGPAAKFQEEYAPASARPGMINHNSSNNYNHYNLSILKFGCVTTFRFAVSSRTFKARDLIGCRIQESRFVSTSVWPSKVESSRVWAHSSRLRLTFQTGWTGRFRFRCWRSATSPFGVLGAPSPLRPSWTASKLARRSRLEVDHLRQTSPSPHRFAPVAISVQLP